jgi:predicted alpha/beta superfamily hydrolase
VSKRVIAFVDEGLMPFIEDKWQRDAKKSQIFRETTNIPK